MFFSKNMWSVEVRWFNNFEFYMVVIPPSRWARTGIPNGVLHIKMPIILSFHSKMWHDIFLIIISVHQPIYLNFRGTKEEKPTLCQVNFEF